MGLSSLFGRRRRYDDISVSINEHIRERTDELVEEGMPPRQAEQTARREFGNVALIQQRSRETWQSPVLESLLADLRFTLRRLRKSPGFAITVLLTLAIGLGANTAVFTVIDNVLLKPLPYPDSAQLTALRLEAPGAPGLANFANGLQLSASLYFTLADHSRSFSSLGIWTTHTANVSGLAKPEEVHTALVSDGILQTLAIPPTVGRWFGAADQDPHGAKTVILSYGYWQRRFGGDRSVLGRSIQLDSQTREIVGVMPRGFRIVDQDFDILVPLAFDRTNLKLAGFGYDGVARLKPGVSLAQADADVARLVPVWMDTYSNGPGTNSHYYKLWRITPAFRPLKQQVIGDASGALWIVMATVGLVMLIACTNVANLLLVRAESRQLELSIRSALGADRTRIARDLLFESLVIGLMGGVLALGVAWGGLHLLVTIGPAELPRLAEIHLDARSVAFTVLLSIASALLFGSIPVWKYARPHLSAALAGSARTTSAGRARQRSRNWLVIAQVAMALVLLVSAVLMIRTFAALRNVDPGFTHPEQLQAIRISIPNSLMDDPRAVTRTMNDIEDKLASVPGVRSVSYSAALPLEGFEPNWDLLSVEGKQYQGGEPPLRLFNYVAPGYFSTVGTRLLAGREYTWTDIYGLRSYVIVSENFARDSWGSPAAAIGKRVRQFSTTPWQEVIGVVQDVRQRSVDEKAPAIIYWPVFMHDPYSHSPQLDAARAVSFVIRSDRAGTETFLAEVQQAVWSVNASLPVARPRTMQQIYAQSLARTSFTLVMLAIAGGMALALGIIGIYGVISYSVVQRTREIGIRLALGAQKNELKWMFVRSALILTGIGVGIGLAAAAGLTQSMRSLLFGFSPLDPLTFLTVPVLLVFAAALASYLPARRATAVNPVEALRID